MILCFEGTPGSGKSYDAVRKIMDNLKLGRTVYTNIEGLDGQEQQEYIKTFCGLDDYELKTRLVFLSHDQIKKFWEYCKSGSLIVIDEVQKYFSNRDWQSQENKAFNSWASTHRHHGYDVVLITQSIDRLDAAVRALVEWTYSYKKLNMFGKWAENRYIRYSYSGDEVNRKPLSKETKKYDERIFRCYKSYVASDIKEQGIMTHANVLRHPVFYSIPVVILFFLYFFSKSSFASGDLFGTDKILKKADAARIAASKPTIKPASPGNTATPTIINPVLAQPTTSPAPKPQVRPTEKVATVKAHQSDDHKTQVSSAIITGLAGSDETVLITIQDRGVVEVIGYTINGGNSVCKDGKCYSIGDSIQL